MLNITVNTGMAGRVTAQVYKKDENGKLVKVTGPKKQATTDNIITTFGLNSINASSLSPQFPNHFLALGEGTQTEALEVEYLNNWKVSSPSIANNRLSIVTKNPADVVLQPVLRNISLSYQFGMPGEPRTYTEVGIASGNQSSSKLYTYTLFRDELGDPTSVVVAHNEFIVVEYSYQTQVMLHYPTDVTVTGTGVPAGTKACFYRKDGVTSSSVICNFYDDEAQVSSSGWEANFDKFHRPDGSLMANGLGYNSSPTSMFYGILDSYNGGDSVGRANITLIPKGSSKTVYLNGTNPLNSLTINESEWGDQTDTKYIVAVGASSHNYFLTFSKGIPWTPAYDKFELTSSVNHQAVNESWIDPSTY